jgi:Pyruvate/2-oxoacid:ferredoxin oxidoreductase gamma subunit
MSGFLRVSPEEIYPRVKSGESLLVCAYDSEETFRGMRLEGAISLYKFMNKVSHLAKDQEIVFYCA